MRGSNHKIELIEVGFRLPNEYDPGPPARLLPDPKSRHGWATSRYDDQIRPWRLELVRFGQIEVVKAGFDRRLALLEFHAEAESGGGEGQI